MKSYHDFWDSAFRKLAQRGAQEFPSIFEEEMVLSGEFLSMIQSGGRVMDFGCGSGRNALYLAGRGHEVSIYDVSQEALAFCERAADSKGLAVQRCRREGRRFDLDDGVFDAVLVWSVFDHMPMFDAMITSRELARVSKQGAVMLASFDPEWDLSYHDDPHEVLEDGAVIYTGGRCKGMLFRRYTNDEVLRVLGSCWEVVEFARQRPEEERVVLCKKK